jgi:hypothetical protein
MDAIRGGLNCPDRLAKTRNSYHTEREQHA